MTFVGKELIYNYRIYSYFVTNKPSGAIQCCVMPFSKLNLLTFALPNIHENSVHPEQLAYKLYIVSIYGTVN